MAHRPRRAPRRSQVKPLSQHDDAMRWTNGLDESITRLASATTDLSVGVAAHTQRLDLMEKQVREQKDETSKLAATHESDYRTLNERISTVQTDLTEKMAKQTETVTNKIDEVKDSIEKAVGERVTRLETWRTFIAGGAFIGAILFTYVLIKLLAKVVPWAEFLK